ncbi:hypothetical protein GCM10010411_05910 [Actinomadura fulvescens]|uniref:ABC transporter domain-containing protein n=1 Tax=Actinomadura fulvescens TaxID=46160 RepID=A0ABP6BLJ9_9ACTN
MRGLDRRFTSRTVLFGLDLDIAPGEFVAVLGDTGAGKSTLLRILAGMDRETYGRLTLPERRAYVFPDARLLPWARVLDNVILGLNDRRRGHLALAEVGLAHRADAWPSALSEEETHRVALARAFVRDPELLLLDEPFRTLGSPGRLRMRELLRFLLAKHRPAVLLATQDPDEAIDLADRVLVLHEGGLVPDGLGKE